MRISRLLAAALIVSAVPLAAPAFADGKKGKQPFEAAKVPKLKTGHLASQLASKTPCPLGPGDRFTTGERPTRHTYNCSGAFVVTDNVASSVTLPDHMETTPAIIHHAGEPDLCGSCAPKPEAHTEIAPEPRQPEPQPAVRPVAMTITLGDSFGNGGVGAGINGGGYGSRAYIVSGGSSYASAGASAVAFAFASSTSVSGGGGSHSCGCGH